MTAPWTKRLSSKPIRNQAADIETERVHKLFTTLGEQVDRLIASGTDPEQALADTATKHIDDIWLSGQFKSVYKQIRAEHFTAPVSKD